ncbi:MAG: hypothetical protein KAT79_04580 [candidate division Zixibacteria bacterium]|nr:hypothetical protein [candidate division Zixibacteria bacterium]
MLTWCALLFGLGLLAFVDSIFNMGEIFRRVNSVFFLLISLGLLVRTTTKMKAKKTEKYESRIIRLEHQVRTLLNGEKKLAEF